MKITKIIINNFRLLKNTEIDLEKELSLIIGKNNCGKTSVLTALTKFLGDQSVTNNFNYNDFNIDLQKDLFECIEKDVEVWKERRCKGIELFGRGNCIKRDDICVAWVRSVMLRILKILVKNNFCYDILILD